MMWVVGVGWESRGSSDGAANGPATGWMYPCGSEFGYQVLGGLRLGSHRDGQAEKAPKCGRAGSEDVARVRASRGGRGPYRSDGSHLSNNSADKYHQEVSAMGKILNRMRERAKGPSRRFGRHPTVIPGAIG